MHVLPIFAAVQLMLLEDDLSILPALSAAEKINRMDSLSKAALIKKKFGSKSSIGSSTSSSSRSSNRPPNSHSGSSTDFKKGVWLI